MKIRELYDKLKTIITIIIILFSSIALAASPPFFASSILSWDGNGAQTDDAYETDEDVISATIDGDIDIGAAYGELSLSSIGYRVNAASEGYHWPNTVPYLDATDGNAQTLYIRFKMLDVIDGTHSVFYANNGNATPAWLAVYIDSESDLNVTWDNGPTAVTHNAVYGYIIPHFWYTVGVSWDTTNQYLSVRIFNGPWVEDADITIGDWNAYDTDSFIRLGTGSSFTMTDDDGDGATGIDFDRFAIVDGYQADLPTGWPGPVNFDALQNYVSGQYEGPFRIDPMGLMIPHYVKDDYYYAFSFYVPPGATDTYDAISYVMKCDADGGYSAGTEDADNGGVFVWEIQPDSGGEPSGTKVAGSSTVTQGGDCGAGAWPDEAIQCDFAHLNTNGTRFPRIHGFDADLTGGNTYWLVVYNSLPAGEEAADFHSINSIYRVGDSNDTYPFLGISKARWRTKRKLTSGGAWAELNDNTFSGAIMSGTYYIGAGYTLSFAEGYEHPVEGANYVKQEITPYRNINVRGIALLVADNDGAGNLLVEIKNWADDTLYSSATIDASLIPDITGSCSDGDALDTNFDCYHRVTVAMPPVELTAYTPYIIKITAENSGSFLVHGARHGGDSDQPVYYAYFPGGYGGIMDAGTSQGYFRRRGWTSGDGYPSALFDISATLILAIPSTISGSFSVGN